MNDIEEEEHKRYYRVKMRPQKMSERDTASNLAIKRQQAKTQYSSVQTERALSLPLSFARQIAPLIAAIEKSEGMDTTRKTPAKSIHLTFTTSADHTELKYDVFYELDAQDIEIQRAVERLVQDKEFMSKVSKHVADVIMSDNTDEEASEGLTPQPDENKKIKKA